MLALLRPMNSGIVPLKDLALHLKNETGKCIEMNRKMQAVAKKGLISRFHTTALSRWPVTISSGSRTKWCATSREAGFTNSVVSL